MTKQIDSQCRQVLLLFSDFLTKEKEICIVKSNEYGYIFLSDIVCGAFEYNAICHTAEMLFREIMFVWEANYLYDIALKNKEDDLEIEEPVLSSEQQSYFDNMKKYFSQELEQILAS